MKFHTNYVFCANKTTFGSKPFRNHFKVLSTTARHCNFSELLPLAWAWRGFKSCRGVFTCRNVLRLSDKVCHLSIMVRISLLSLRCNCRNQLAKSPAKGSCCFAHHESWLFVVHIVFTVKKASKQGPKLDKFSDKDVRLRQCHGTRCRTPECRCHATSEKLCNQQEKLPLFTGRILH